MPVNIKNPAIKRIHADVRELMKDPSDQYHAAPLESNLFEWHFTIRGPPDTEFEGGVYHGRIILPPEYPFRPPDIMFNTPNGRFSTGMKICLTISSYHPEHWQPAWGIRLILEALISFFPSPSHGALGGLDWSAGERKRLAVESRKWKCYKCGLVADLLPELRPKGESGGASSRSSYADQIKELHKLKAKTADEVAAESPVAAAAAAAASDDREPGTSVSESPSGKIASTRKEAEVIAQASGEKRGGIGAISETTATTAPSSPRLRSGGGAPAEGGGDPTPSPANARGASEVEGNQGQQQQQQQESREDDLGREDDVLSFVAIAIALAIVGILVRKALRLAEVI
ncbi:unnamed protein product [Ectocarpus sp. 6 AP-2014]